VLFRRVPSLLALLLQALLLQVLIPQALLLQALSLQVLLQALCLHGLPVRQEVFLQYLHLQEHPLAPWRQRNVLLCLQMQQEFYRKAYERLQPAFLSETLPRPVFQASQVKKRKVLQ